MRTIHVEFQRKPTYLFLTHRSVESRRLQGTIWPFILYTETKKYSNAQAYVGGLFREQGMDVVRRWLYPLFQPLVDVAYQAERRDYLLPESAAPAPTLQPMRQRDPSPQIGDFAKMDTSREASSFRAYHPAYLFSF